MSCHIIKLRAGTQTNTQIQTRTHKYTCAHTRTHIHTHIYTHARTHIHTHTHTHTHTQTSAESRTPEASTSFSFNKTRCVYLSGFCLHVFTSTLSQKKACCTHALKAHICVFIHMHAYKYARTILTETFSNRLESLTQN